MEVKGKVIKGWVGVLSTPTMEVKEGVVSPQTLARQKKWRQCL
jgi:hypothetical protein